MKLVEDRLAPAFADEPLGDRVYGSRPENHDGARRLLAGVAHLPALFASGVRADDAGLRWRYWIMEQLSGATDLDWSETRSPDARQLHRLAGETLARIHEVTRAYPGWVALSETERWDWGPALLEALRDAISRAGAGAQVLESCAQTMARFCSACATRLWHEPDAHPQIRGLRPGTLDDPSRYTPYGDVWTRSARSWVSFTGGASIRAAAR